MSDRMPDSVHDGDWPSFDEQLGEAADLDLDALFEAEPVEALELSLGDEQF